MISNNNISLIIPCKNEEKSIGKMLSRVPGYVDEVVVVDNGSSDKTSEVAKSFGVKVVRELRVDKNGIGYGYAHQAGIKEASGDIFVTVDGDGTYPMRQIKEGVDYMLQNELDFVTCSRFPLMNGNAISWFRKFGVWLLNMETRILFKYKINDVLSGMWVMKREIKSELELKEGGWDFSPEIKIEALTNKSVKFGQYHINHKPRRDGVSKQQLWQTGFNHLKYIFMRRFVNVRFMTGRLMRNFGITGLLLVMVKLFTREK